jgi:hypothetical protein
VGRQGTRNSKSDALRVNCGSRRVYRVTQNDFVRDTMAHHQMFLDSPVYQVAALFFSLWSESVSDSIDLKAQQSFFESSTAHPKTPSKANSGLSSSSPTLGSVGLKSKKSEA